MATRVRILYAFGWALFGAIFVFTLVRSWHFERWSGWAFGDVQTMLAVRHWQEEGFLALNFLWVPQGYAHTNKWLDSPEISHHAHGIHGIDSGIGGHKRIYTHYPSWYALPYGLLGKLGIYHKSIYQTLALLISFGGMLLAFYFWKSQISKAFALLFVLRHLMMPSFLEYCDSLSNLPYDDLFRFAFMGLWWRYHQTAERRFFGAALGVYFLSSLVSLDSLGFIPTWAFFYNLFFRRKVGVSELLLLLIAPLIAFGIQFTQNTLYLGWQNALKDWGYYYYLGSQAGSPSHSFLSAFGQWMAHRWDLILVLLERTARYPLWKYAFILAVLWGLSQKKNPFSERFLWGHLMALFCACGSFILYAPNKINMAYQIRQFNPLIALTYSLLIYLVWYQLSSIKMSRISWLRRTVNGTLILFGILYLKILYTEPLDKKVDYPPKAHLAVEERRFFEQIRTLNSNDKIVFQLGDVLRPLNYFSGQPQVYPLYEYYADAPVFSHVSEQGLATDIAFFWAKREKPLTLVALVPEERYELFDQVLNTHEFYLERLSPTLQTDKGILYLALVGKVVSSPMLGAEE